MNATKGLECQHQWATGYLADGSRWAACLLCGAREQLEPAPEVNFKLTEVEAGS